MFAVGVGARPQERVLRRIAKLTGGEYFAVDQARGAGPGRAHRGPRPPRRPGAERAAAAARRARPGAAPARRAGRLRRRCRTGGHAELGRRRAVWIALASPPAAAFALVVAAWRQKRAVPTCPDVRAPAARRRFELRVLRGAPADARTTRRGRSRRWREPDPTLSATVLARMNTTEEYLERTVTLQERPVLAITRGPRRGPGRSS